LYCGAVREPHHRCLASETGTTSSKSTACAEASCQPVRIT